MTRSEFLNELEIKLQGLPEDDLKERLSFYEKPVSPSLGYRLFFLPFYGRALCFFLHEKTLFSYALNACRKTIKL